MSSVSPIDMLSPPPPAVTDTESATSASTASKAGSLAIALTPPALPRASGFGYALDKPSATFKPLRTKMGEGEIKMGTLGGASFRQLERLNKTNPDRNNMMRAFTELKADLKVAYPEMQRMTIDVDNCMVTLVMDIDKKEHLTIGEVKAALIKHKKCTADEAEQKMANYFGAFNTAFNKSSITTIAHYDPMGKDVLGSRVGGEAMKVTRHSDPLVQDKQAKSLALDYKKKKHHMMGSIARMDPTKQKEAVKKVLSAEAFAIHLKEKLQEHAKALTEDYRKSPTEAKKTTLRDYNRLAGELGVINRHALWFTAIYDKPEECYDGVLRDFYEEKYGHIKEESDKPSFEEFCNSPDASAHKQHAAEIASMLITNAKDYRLFCTQHETEPRDDHVNRFINQAFQDPSQIDFENLGFHFDPAEGDKVKTLIAHSKTATSLSRELSEIDSTGTLSAEALFKAAMKADNDKGIGALLRDKASEEPPGMLASVTNWIFKKK